MKQFARHQLILLHQCTGKPGTDEYEVTTGLYRVKSEISWDQLTEIGEKCLDPKGYYDTFKMRRHLIETGLLEKVEVVEVMIGDDDKNDLSAIYAGDEA